MIKSRQKRASAPKTRAGCLTCKVRRVKCDETKPRCLPCTKSRRDCQWKRTVPNQSSSRILVPITPQSTRSPSSSNTSELILQTPTQALPFVEAREMLYFRAYEEEVSRELSGALLSSPWFQSVLQACHTAPFILRAVVAVGALNKSFKLSHFAQQGPISMKAMTLQAAASHREFALTSYAKAISGMKAISLGPPTPLALRHLLIAGLLVHCMELFLESPESAFQHSQAGYQLLLNWISSNPSPSRSYKWLSSPNTTILEDTIFQEYTRLDAEHALSVHSPSLMDHQKGRTLGTDTIKNMPSRFGSLEEARSYQELLTQRATHLVGEIGATTKQIHLLFNHPQTADFPGHIFDPCHVLHLSHLLPVRDAHLSDLNRWRTAFAPLLAALSLEQDTRLSVGSAMLEVRIVDLVISLTNIFSTTETSFNAAQTLHGEMLSLIQHSIKVTPHVCTTVYPVFQTSTSFHHPMANLVMYCRDQAIRQLTLDIILRMSPRDKNMDRKRWICRIKYLADLEEQGRLEDGSIPEENRYRIISWHTHGKENTYTVVCGRRNGYPIGEAYPAKWEYRFKTFTAENAENFIVGELARDDDKDGVEKERRREIRRWPRGLEKPNWLKWEEVHREIKKRGSGKSQPSLSDSEDSPEAQEAVVEEAVVEEGTMESPDWVEWTDV